MSKRWYVTVGVPGGEFPVKAKNAQDARDLLSAEDDKIQAPFAPQHYWDETIVRLAPPDLVAWLDNKPPPGAGKVPGGWLYEFLTQRELQNGTWNQNMETTATQFIPVALAPGITILGDDDG